MKLAYKLTLAFLLVSLIAVGLAAVFVWIVTSIEFTNYLQNQRQNSFAEAAQAYYQQSNTWNGVGRALQQQGLLPAPSQPGGPQQPPPPFALVDQNHIVIVPGGSFTPGTRVQDGLLTEGTQITVNGKIVGTVMSTGQPLVRNAVEQRYIEAVNRALLIAALVGMLIAFILGGVLAQTLIRPVNELTHATRAMASGKLEQQVPVRSNDELGELAASFNQMSSDLARANQSRRQMTADIAHDLRNPLTVIGGYLESLQDGVLEPTPERFTTMYSEVQHLQHMVEDLRTLSLADSGDLVLHRQPIRPGELLERVAAAYRHQAGQQKIKLTVEVEPGLAETSLDVERMEQVLGNLISNALRYTPQDGEIRLTAQKERGALAIEVRDTGSGIPAEVLPHIFERSYRGDLARSEDGSGLGLAIAKSILEYHGGSISVTSSPGEGTQFRLMLPNPGPG